MDIQGDGLSRATALFFDKAESHGEAIAALYRHLAQSGITVRRRELAGMGGGFLYDRMETDRGELWVRYRMTI